MTPVFNTRVRLAVICYFKNQEHLTLLSIPVSKSFLQGLFAQGTMAKCKPGCHFTDRAVVPPPPLEAWPADLGLWAITCLWRTGQSGGRGRQRKLKPGKREWAVNFGGSLVQTEGRGSAVSFGSQNRYIWKLRDKPRWVIKWGQGTAGYRRRRKLLGKGEHRRGL